jgi:hypothetical protein
MNLTNRLSLMPLVAIVLLLIAATNRQTSESTDKMDKGFRRYNMKAIIIGYMNTLILLVLLCSHPIIYLFQDHKQSTGTSKDFRTALPEKIIKLMSWPDIERLKKHIVQPEDSSEAMWAKRYSIEWILKIINPRWLPDNPKETLDDKLVLLEDAYDGLDTSHVEWQKDRYIFRVSQTRTVFYLDVTPTQGSIAEGKSDDIKKAVRELTSIIIKDNINYKSSSGNDIIAKNTLPILLNNCFDEARVKQYDDILVGKPKDLTAVSTRDTNLTLNEKLDLKYSEYWWRKISWLTNGRTFGLFTLKDEGGAWLPSYNGPDKDWFRKEKVKADKSQ